jgi:hypothetical protein
MAKTKGVAFTDTYEMDSENTQMRETADGYLVCQPRIARTGIQLYSGAEVGRPDLQTVRVYRPETEVMHKDSLKSLAGKPVTVEHPDEPVTAKNWKDLAVGHMGDEVLRDGDFIRVPMILMDSNAIDIARGGKRQLSVGYTAVLQWADGVTPKGEAYDVMQTSIRANHVAITHTARGGDKLRMGDSRERNGPMRKILIDGISVEMEERDLQVVERRLASLEADLAAAKTNLATAQTTAQNDVATARTETANATAIVQTKDAEIATLKQQLADTKLSPQKLDQMVNDRVQTVQRAKALLDSVVVDAKSDAEIRRQVVSAKLGDVAKDWNDDMVTASFNTLTVATGDNGNGLGSVVNLLRNNDTGGNDPRAKSYETYETDLQNRWKTAGQRTA